jgi:hypothetical protein
MNRKIVEEKEDLKNDFFYLSELFMNRKLRKFKRISL